jgi:tetratricopeptide (TPR) repeat protein
VYRGDWFGGTRKGLSSVSSFKDALRLDSGLCDACAGIGAFYYWRSKKTESFNWLPFVGDDRNEGLSLLNTCVERGIYNRYTALNMLSAIYTDAALYEQAAACSRKGLERYPENRSFLWGLATALQKSSKWKEAAGAYRMLLDAILRSKDNNHYNEIVCMLNLATVSAQVAEFEYARRLLTDICKYRESDFPVHLQERIKDKLEKARTLIAQLGRAGSPAGK